MTFQNSPTCRERYFPHSFNGLWLCARARERQFIRKKKDGNHALVVFVFIESASEVSSALSFNLHLPHLFRKRRRENRRRYDTRPRSDANAVAFTERERREFNHRVGREHAFLFVHNHWYFQESFGGLFVLL